MAPLVVGRVPGRPGAPRLGLYAHYDGQPVTPADWATPPFEPTLIAAGGATVPLPAPGEPVDDEWRLHASAAADDKAPIAALLAALAALDALDALDALGAEREIELVLCLEGEEESGSPHLGELMLAYSDELAASAWLICDGPVRLGNAPQVVLGVRGFTDLELTVYGPARELHSGHYGNWAPNPALALARLLASMKDDAGRVTIDGFTADTRKPTAAEQAALDAMPAVEDELLDRLGLAAAEVPGSRLLDRLMLPSLNVRGHNFIRLWRWEHIRSQAAGGDYYLDMTPQPWARTGPGAAKDGRPRFDLDRPEPAFFERLRARVTAAGEAGVYVGVMLFDGWALHLSPAPDQIEGHPFHALNNVNGVAATSIDDLQVLPLDPRVEQLQATYIRQVVDVLHDLPNVLWEVANESSGDGSAPPEFADLLGLDRLPSWGDSTAWQYGVIDLVREHEARCGYDPHPIGMTMQFPVADQTRANEPLLRSRAEWISPGYDDDIFAAGGHPMAPGSPPSRWLADPPVTDAAKVIITDTDHYPRDRATRCGHGSPSSGATTRS